MKQTIRFLLALAALCPPVLSQVSGTAPGSQEVEPTVMLRLRDGGVLFGSILSNDPTGIRFSRLDNGGKVDLNWSFLDPDEAYGLRLRFGYVDTDSEEMFVDAERLVLDDGTELIGLIVNRTDDHLWLKRASGTLPVAKRRLTGATAAVRVPALDIYTREELYQQKAFELQVELLADGLEGAIAHDQLAQYSERLRDYGHAVEHYGHTRTLGPDYDVQRVTAALGRCEAKAAVQDQVNLLEEIDRFGLRKRYDLALQGLTSFSELYPNSPLLEDWNKLRSRVERAQGRDLREQIVRSVYARSARLARELSRKKISYEEVLAYLDETMGEELMRSVQEDLGQLAPGISTEDVERLWGERTGGRYRQASFGHGTWLLGESRALEAYESSKDAKKEPAKGSKAEKDRKTEDRVKRYLQNVQLTRRAKAGGSNGEDDPVAFWNQWDSSGRYNWILAHFVEYSGLFHIDRVRFANCRECGGSGARDVLYTGSARTGSNAAHSRLIPCPTCHTIGSVRRIRYR